VNIALLKSRLSIGKGGLEKTVYRLADAFAQRGHYVTVLTTECETEKLGEIEIVNVGNTPKRGYRQLLTYDRLCQRWLEKNPQNIVFGMDRNRQQTHYRAGNGVHRAYLESRKEADPWWKKISFDFNPLHRTLLQLEKEAYESPRLQMLFTNSQMVKDEILYHYCTPPSKVQVVHNGVEWEEMQHDFDDWPTTRVDLQRKLGLNPDAYQLLFIGHGYQRKGLQFLLQGLAQLNNKKIQLSVIGKDRVQKKFITIAKKLGIEQQVFFFGAQENVRPFYQIADALAIPSLYDPFANVTLEALAMGLFVVSSKRNGGYEILNQHNGYVIEDLNEGVASALQNALNHRKTVESAQKIRNEVQKYSYYNQLLKMIQITESSVHID